MPPVHYPPQRPPDLSSVRSLITSATRAARACGISTTAVYRWIKVNRIPGRYLTKIANLYDVELMDLLPLTGSDKSYVPPVVLKPRNTLDVLMDVYNKKIDVQQASTHLGVSTKSLNSVLFNWGDKLPVLHAVLTQLSNGQISLDQACNLLGVAKYTLHGIRRKYGFAPGIKRVAKPESKLKIRKDCVMDGIHAVLRGEMTAKELAAHCNVSYRTVFRYIDKIEPGLDLNEITNWPQVFRFAYASEIIDGWKRYVRDWLKFGAGHALYLPKRRAALSTPAVWSGLPVKRLMVGVLLDEASLDAVAASRKADPDILRAIFSQDLQPLGMDWAEVESMGVLHQQALAELLIAVMDRRRRT